MVGYAWSSAVIRKYSTGPGAGPRCVVECHDLTDWPDLNGYVSHSTLSLLGSGWARESTSTLRQFLYSEVPNISLSPSLFETGREGSSGETLQCSCPAPNPTLRRSHRRSGVPSSATGE